MMETIKSWALSVISAVAVTAIINLISPSGVIEKPLKILTAFFMLICFVSPIADADFTAFDSDLNYEMSQWLDDGELEREVRKEVTDTLKNEIYSNLNAYLESEEITDYEINIQIDIKDDNSIDLSDIEIILSDPADMQKIIDYVETTFEITPNISIKTEG